MASGLTTISPAPAPLSTSMPVSTVTAAASYLLWVAARFSAAVLSSSAATPEPTAIAVTPSSVLRFTAFASARVSPGCRSASVTGAIVTLCSPKSSFTASATLMLPPTALICFAVKVMLDSISRTSISVQLELASKTFVPDTVNLSVSPGLPPSVI